MTKKGQETVKHYTEMNDYSWKNILVLLVMAPLSFVLACSLYLFVFYVVPISVLWVVKALLLVLNPLTKIL